MKIGILTFHFAHNYGAMLQAYALSTKICKLGYDAEIIDYRLPAIYINHEKLSFFKFFLKERKKCDFLRAILKTVKNYWKNRFRGELWDNFEYFLNQILKKSKRIDEETLKNIDYDVVFLGSDQIWNSKLTGGLSSVYFGFNLPKCKRKSAYAASCGSEKIPLEDMSLFSKWTKSFYKISVREQNFSKYINENLGLCSKTVVDPIFLLNREEWRELCPIPMIEEDYIFVYSFNEDDFFYEVLKELSDREKSKIIAVKYKKDNRYPSGVKQIDNAGPLQFMNYIYYAKNVLTNSFHGTAFSILFNKKFVSVKPKLFSERLDSLLNLCELQDHLISKKENITKIDEEIPYKKVDEILQRMKNSSVEFIKDCLK
ncbi:MAG: polysaccharide pyruvyl transferase family protein [Clostridia bacterium]|nr:polysaccharide pyruvyl transferase family protein [Clostridia bacterium]